MLAMYSIIMETHVRESLEGFWNRVAQIKPGNPLETMHAGSDDEMMETMKEKCSEEETSAEFRQARRRLKKAVAGIVRVFGKTKKLEKIGDFETDCM